MTQEISHDIEIPIPPIEKKVLSQQERRLERRIKKAKLRKLMGRVTVKRKKKSNKRSHNIIIPANIRTIYEQKFESYLKLLDIPYYVDYVFCLRCGNMYYYGNNDYIPKTCMVCMEKFYSPKEKRAYLARPDIILDFNDDDIRLRYRQDCQHHRINSINNYKKEYFTKISIVRIDGSVHDKQTTRIKDYIQYKTFVELGVKVFIVRNEDIDKLLLDRKDNGKELLKLCHMIGDATIDEEKYKEYCQDKDFIERTMKPV